MVVIKHVDSTAGKNKKFNIKYRGLYCVIKCIGNDRYHVTDVENCQLLQMPYDNIVDSSRMKMWLESREPNETDKKGYTDDQIVSKSSMNSQQQFTLSDHYTNYEFLDEENYTDYEYLDEHFNDTIEVDWSAEL